MSRDRIIFAPEVLGETLHSSNVSWLALSDSALTSEDSSFVRKCVVMYFSRAESPGCDCLVRDSGAVSVPKRLESYPSVK